MKIKMGCFSNDGKYCAICTESGAYVYDINRKNSVPMFYIGRPDITGILFDGTELYLSLKNDSVIYRWEQGLLFETAAFSGEVILRSFVKGSNHWVIAVEETLMAYDPQEQHILHVLPLQVKFRDYAFHAVRKEAVLIALEITFYDDEDDENHIEMAMCNYENGIINASLGTFFEYDNFYERTSYWPREGEYKWPLLQYSDFIPAPFACTSDGEHVLYAVKDYGIIANPFTGKVERLIKDRTFFDKALAVYMDAQMTTLSVVLEDAIRIYQLQEIPEEEGNALAEKYPLLRRRGGNGEKHREFGQIFERVKEEYGELKVMWEIGK